MGLTPPWRRRRSSLLDEGMALAENDEVRRRVEKVSIAPRTVLIEPFARWVRNHQHEIISTPGSKAPPEAYSGIESELREVFRLYERYGVDHFAE